MRTASKISFVPPSIETIRRVRPRVENHRDRTPRVISVPFVIRSLNGTPCVRSAARRSGKSRVMNGSVMQREADVIRVRKKLVGDAVVGPARQIVFRQRGHARIAEAAHPATQIALVVLIHEDAQEAVGGRRRTAPQELPPQLVELVRVAVLGHCKGYETDGIAASTTRRFDVRHRNRQPQLAVAIVERVAQAARRRRARCRERPFSSRRGSRV